MTVKLYAFTCGTVTCEFAHLMEGGEGDITVPIPVFLIEHPKGRVLFDTGLHPDCQHDPAGRLGPRLAGLFRIAFLPGEEVSARLEAIDRDPGKVDLIINSHFHFDHVGGNALIPNATMLVQCREWEAGMDPETAARRGFNPRDFDLGHKSRLVDGEHDVFGDGSVVCLPTYGHTPGHQSLRLRLDHGEVVLAADACYFCQTSADRDLANQPVMGGGVAHHPADAVEKKERNLWLTSSSGHYVWIGHHFCYSLKREDFRMVDYQTIAELVNQISVDTWHVLREITQRRPAMMLSELIDCKTRASQQPERQEPRSPTNEPINPG